MRHIKPTTLASALCTSTSLTKAPTAKTHPHSYLTNDTKIRPAKKEMVNRATPPIMTNHVSQGVSAKIKVLEILVGAVVTITVSTFSNLPSLMNFYDKYIDRTSSIETVADQSEFQEDQIVPRIKSDNFDSTNPENWVGYGCTNDSLKVLEVQKSLNHRMNAGLVCDGKFGVETYKAIIKFQGTINGIQQDGIVGPLTWRWLLNDNESI